MLLLYRANGRLPQLCRFIYIPLCFYFIGVLAPSALIAKIFTFHYASTLSVHLLQKSLRGNLFTFHYASTLSIQKWRRSIKCINLHSTMLLLYLTEDEDVTIPAKFTFHYASTLSDKTHRHYRADYWFTFHYASTLSTCPIDTGQNIANLHSTMLLLYLKREEARQDTIYNLHSTMLLLYLFSVQKICNIWHIYIPLCFYFIAYPISASLSM